MFQVRNVLCFLPRGPDLVAWCATPTFSFVRLIVAPHALLIFKQKRNIVKTTNTDKNHQYMEIWFGNMQHVDQII